MANDVMLEPSILNSVKQLLQIPPDYPEYDPNIVMHINGYLGDISDLGIGPDEGFIITGAEETWDQFLGVGDVLYQGAKMLLFLKCRLAFDPPQSSVGVNAIEKQIEQFTWRLSVRREYALSEETNQTTEPVELVQYVDLSEPDSGGGLLP